MATRIELKRGSLGDIYRETSAETSHIVRDLSTAQWPWLARKLAHREARALSRLDGLSGIPSLIALDRDQLVRSFLPGEVMHEGSPRSRKYFKEALRLVRRIHRRGVTHNDLAKEANWICRSEQEPGIVDFQLAICFTRRSRLFRLLALEDLRHLLKHKRYYRPDTLTQRQRNLLANPMWTARIWKLIFKPGYRFVTRRMLGWTERNGPHERQRRA